MLKVKFIAWPADDISFKVKSGLTDDEAAQIEVMTRRWANDQNFTEVGIFTENLGIAKGLAKQYKGQVWIISPKAA